MRALKSADGNGLVWEVPGDLRSGLPVKGVTSMFCASNVFDFTQCRRRDALSAASTTKANLMHQKRFWYATLDRGPGRGSNVYQGTARRLTSKNMTGMPNLSSRVNGDVMFHNNVVNFSLHWLDRNTATFYHDLRCVTILWLVGVHVKPDHYAGVWTYLIHKENLGQTSEFRSSECEDMTQRIWCASFLPPHKSLTVYCVPGLSLGNRKDYYR